ncbi:MAG: fimbrillin family protein, partial [Candidatus Saccharimonadaceae bacterium]
MKNQLIMFLSVIVLLSLSSCLQDHPDVAKIVDIAKEIKVTASIVGQNDQNSISTRASDETWANGDAIGIFMKKKESVLSIPSLIENAKYDFTSDYNFVAATSKVLYFPFDSSKVDFIAYYPFKEGLKGIEYDIDVSKQNDLTKIDLLYSNNVVGKDRFTEIIKFDFKHQLVNVILNFTLDATAGDLKGLIAEISNLNTKATFLLSDGTIKSQSESDTIAFNMNADGTKGQAILLPLDSLENKYLIVKHKGLSYKLNLGKIKNIISFEKGTKYIYNITIKPNLGFVIKSLTTSIENWIPVTSEEIIADEGIPVEDEAGTVGEEVVPPVEDEGPIEGEVPGGDVDPNVGDGTQAKPYSIAQAKLETGKTKVWVKGYIVGA